MESSLDTLVRLSKGKEVYRLKSGVIVPGVTEVLKIYADYDYAEWANEIGLKGQKLKDYRDPLGDVGRLAHMEITAMFDGRDPSENEQDFPPHIQDLASNCFLSACAWAKAHEIGETIAAEKRLTSEGMKYGGTPDRVWYVDGELEVTDFKTGSEKDKDIIQAAAYVPLLIENGLVKRVDRVRLVYLSRDEDERFKDKPIIGPMAEWEIFQHLLAIYWNRRDRKR